MGHGWLNHAGLARVGVCDLGDLQQLPDGTEHFASLPLADVPQTAQWCGFVANSGLENPWALN